MEAGEAIRAQLARQLESGRVHSGYLFSGPGSAPRDTALWFARAVACEARPAERSREAAAGPTRPCEACRSCRRSAGREEIPLDGTGKSGPLLRHVGDHPDLLWVERGADDTRVRIGQVRALQAELRLRSNEGGPRVAVLADAEWLNQESQNALLRTLEEPPPRTTLVLVTASAAGLLATVRSRCQRYAFPVGPGLDPDAPDAPEALRDLAQRLDALSELGLAELLEVAEEYRGGRAEAAEAVQALLAGAGAWLRREVRARAAAGPDAPGLAERVDAFRELQACRKALAQRNANPQMVAERALLALREAVR
jgi:DNA polymerase-3 subunit delta'